MPALDEAALERLSDAFDREGVIAAMLIGSQARGIRGRFQMWISLSGMPLDWILVPVLIFSSTSPAMRGVPWDRRGRDRDERVRLETRAILDYLDTAPLRAELGRGVQRMKEGRFGRDLGTQVVSEQSARPPSDYAEVFKILGEKEVISDELALRMGNAAKQAISSIVHLYMEIDEPF